MKAWPPHVIGLPHPTSGTTTESVKTRVLSGRIPVMFVMETLCPSGEIEAVPGDAPVIRNSDGPDAVMVSELIVELPFGTSFLIVTAIDVVDVETDRGATRL